MIYESNLSVICVQITFHLQMAASPNDPQQQWMQQQQQQQQQMPKLSDEEQRVMASCQSESFWFRSIPASGFLAFLAHMGVSNGTLKPHSRWGSRPKVILGATVGYFIGKFSYVNACADKFLVEAPDSHIADVIRIKRGIAPRNIQQPEDQQQPGYGDGYGGFPQVQQQSPIYTNPNSPTYDPNIASQAPGQQSSLSGYDELRRKNRENQPGFSPSYQRQIDPGQSLSSSPNLQSLPSQPPPPSPDSAPPSKLRPLPRSSNNKYGDEGFE